MKYDYAIIGGGIVGLATARAILKSKPGASLVLIEKEKSVAQHQTTHNSGVIHSGIYYKPGSLKASNCILGYGMMIDFCKEFQIPFEICGKIIVATEETELQSLENIYERGIANGLTGLKKLSKEEIKEIEPNCSGISGIRVPQTGIIDYGAVSRKLRELIEKSGATVVTGTKVTGIERKTDLVIQSTSGDFQANSIVSCGGLYSDRIARMSSPDVKLQILPFRGEYYEIKPERRSLVKHLIYPVPDPNFPFLGVHFTRMISGGVEAGPNAVLAFSREGYSKWNLRPFDLLRVLTFSGFHKVAQKYWRTGLGEYYRSYSKSAFVKALQRLVPSIQKSDLVPGGSGVRAQACDPSGSLLDDFYFHEEKNILHVCNAPSPAATSSLSLGKLISEKLLSA